MQNAPAFPLEARGPDFVSRDATATRSRLLEASWQGVDAAPLGHALQRPGVIDGRAASPLDASGSFWVDFPNGLKLSTKKPQCQSDGIAARTGKRLLLVGTGDSDMPGRVARLRSTRLPPRPSSADRIAAPAIPPCTIVDSHRHHPGRSLIVRPPGDWRSRHSFDAHSRWAPPSRGCWRPPKSRRVARHDALLRPRPGAARLLRDTIVTTLLESFPHNYSDWFGRGQFGVRSSGRSRQALDHIAAHIVGTLTVQQVADAVGTSVRSLQQGFQLARTNLPAGPSPGGRAASCPRQDGTAGPGNSRSSIEEVARRWKLRQPRSFRARLSEAAWRAALQKPADRADPARVLRRKAPSFLWLMGK